MMSRSSNLPKWCVIFMFSVHDHYILYTDTHSQYYLWQIIKLSLDCNLSGLYHTYRHNVYMYVSATLHRIVTKYIAHIRELRKYLYVCTGSLCLASFRLRSRQHIYILTCGPFFVQYSFNVALLPHMQWTCHIEKINRTDD